VCVERKEGTVRLFSIAVIVTLASFSIEGKAGAVDVKKLGDLLAAGFEIKATTTLAADIVVVVQKGSSAYFCGVQLPLHAAQIGKSDCLSVAP
jgi:hypothetical protein